VTGVGDIVFDVLPHSADGSPNGCGMRSFVGPSVAKMSFVKTVQSANPFF
jgi:hypothetical protein